MSACIILALGACVVSIMAGLSGIGQRRCVDPNRKRSESREPMKPQQLPPEIIAVLNRNERPDGRGVPLAHAAGSNPPATRSAEPAGC
jgi:hypothetical protein